MKKTKLKNIIYEDPSIVYSEQLKLNVCCFRELEDVNVFLFCVLDSLHFVPESELCLICPPWQTEKTFFRDRPELGRRQNSEFGNLIEL